MAKTTLNSALKRISGKIDNWVYRKYGDGVIIARRPESNGPASPAQLAVRERFRLAANYAREILADPVRLPAYAAAARARGLSVFAFIMGDYLRPPVVEALDLAGYHGIVGDLIKVSASDTFRVAAVHIAIRDGDGAVLEEGPATLTDGRWTYTATTGIAPPSETVTIEATATDVPGHTGSQTATTTVG